MCEDLVIKEAKEVLKNGRYQVSWAEMDSLIYRLVRAYEILEKQVAHLESLLTYTNGLLEETCENE